MNIRTATDESRIRGRKLVAHNRRELAVLLSGPNGQQVARDLITYFVSGGVPVAQARTSVMEMTRTPW